MTTGEPLKTFFLFSAGRFHLKVARRSSNKKLIRRLFKAYTTTMESRRKEIEDEVDTWRKVGYITSHRTFACEIMNERMNIYVVVARSIASK